MKDEILEQLRLANMDQLIAESEANELREQLAGKERLIESQREMLMQIWEIETVDYQALEDFLFPEIELSRNP
jgi:ERCC4-type nuclease